MIYHSVYTKNNQTLYKETNDMLGTIVNTVAVIIGAAIGMLLKKGIPEKCHEISSG